MKNWWVNHKQTYRQEVDGGYIWSLKTRKDGSNNHFYENLQRFQAGDLVFSFANVFMLSKASARLGSLFTYP